MYLQISEVNNTNKFEIKCSPGLSLHMYLLTKILTEIHKRTNEIKKNLYIFFLKKIFLQQNYKKTQRAAPGF